MEGLIEGRIVHYVDAEHRHHAAAVIEIFNLEAGYVSLRSFYDLKTYVATFGAGRQEPTTWHWIERA